MASPSAQTILVTGANGYATLHILNQLLKAGYNVRGTVRSQTAVEKVRNVFPQYWGTQLDTAFVTDLTKPESYSDALDDKITGVIHAASPVHGDVKDNVRDMLDPAIKGATAILDAISKMSPCNVKRVVHLSSFAAILDPLKGSRSGYNYSEEDWNPVTFEEAACMTNGVELYLASKALSERAVWDWVELNKPGFEMVSVNPSMILGPHLDKIQSVKTTSTGAMLWALVDAPEVPPLQFAGAVDARDVGIILVSALETPGANGQRFLVANHFDWQTTADAVRNNLPQIRNRIPAGEPGTGKSKALEQMYQANGSKVTRVLGVQYRPLEETIRDSFSEYLDVEKRAGTLITLDSRN